MKQVAIVLKAACDVEQCQCVSNCYANWYSYFILRTQLGYLLVMDAVLKLIFALAITGIEVRRLQLKKLDCP